MTPGASTTAILCRTSLGNSGLMEEKNTASASPRARGVPGALWRIPSGEGGAAKIHEVDFDSFLDDLLCQAFEKGFLVCI